jgi:type IV secretory pathway VirB10-like protein
MVCSLEQRSPSRELEKPEGSSMATYRVLWLSVIVALVSGSVVSAATYIYPKKGQSKQRQNKDKGECTVWATDETGFDPANPPPPPAAPPPPGAPPPPPTSSGSIRDEPNAIRGAGRGAALGAIGGAIAGDAGKGAAAGAAIGGVGGAIRKRDTQRERQQQYEQQVSAEQRQYQQQVSSQRQQYDAKIRSLRSDYNRAFAACMEARDYTVK